MIPHKGALKSDEMEKLWHMYTNDGYTQTELAEKFRISQSTVSNCISRVKYDHEIKELKELKKKAMQQRMRPYIGDAETAGDDQ